VERVEYDEDASSAIITFVEDDGKCILIDCRIWLVDKEKIHHGLFQQVK
jgi:hypothetical protein